MRHWVCVVMCWIMTIMFEFLGCAREQCTFHSSAVTVFCSCFALCIKTLFLIVLCFFQYHMKYLAKDITLVLYFPWRWLHKHDTDRCDWCQHWNSGSVWPHSPTHWKRIWSHLRTCSVAAAVHISPIYTRHINRFRIWIKLNQIHVNALIRIVKQFT